MTYQITYKDKQVYVEENPRNGVCNYCRRVRDNTYKKQFAIHHVQYHDDNPLKDTIESCPACHSREHHPFVKTTKTAFDVSRELHKKLKIKAAQNGTTMTDLVVGCLEKIVEK